MLALASLTTGENDMSTDSRYLAETFLAVINTRDPDLVDRFISEDYRNHNAFVADGREANRQFPTAFLAGLPDVGATMEVLPPLAAGPEAQP